MSIQIRNPHSVLAALRARPKDVIQVTLPPKGGADDAWERVADLARQNHIKFGQSSAGSSGARRGSSRPNDQGGRTSVAEATIREKEPISAEELFKGAKDRAGGKGLWLALDSLQDPQNVGAIFRAAAFFGVQGILITSERSAPLTASAYDVSSGGIEDVPFTQQVNLQRGFEVAKENGLWILGTSEHAKEDITKIARDRPWLLVLGNEEKGIRRLTEESCDLTCRIAPKGQGVTSLNVSVAAGILMSRLA